jgi:hypothetical protein
MPDDKHGFLTSLRAAAIERVVQHLAPKLVPAAKWLAGAGAQTIVATVDAVTAEQITGLVYGLTHRKIGEYLEQGADSLRWAITPVAKFFGVEEAAIEDIFGTAIDSLDEATQAARPN